MNSRFSVWERLPAIFIALVAALFSVSAYCADEVMASSHAGTGNGHPVAEAKQAAKDVGHGVKKGTTAIGHGFRDGTKAVGHGTKNAAKEVGHETRKVTKEVGHAVRDGVHKAEGKAD